MIIYGADFTSSPSAKKPIACAVASLVGTTLTVTQTVVFSSFRGFEGLLRSPGPWRAGFDFPFGQPRKFLENLNIEGDWAEYVGSLTGRARGDFERLLADYRQARPRGDRHHFRRTDELAGSCSPMMLYRVPVAKMFFEGAPRLWRSGVSILPVCRRKDSRVAVEGYPKLVAMRYSGGARYKSESKRGQTELMKHTRARILAGVAQHARRDYGFWVKITAEVREAAIDDPTGDLLDAILCAVQAAWSKLQITPADGIPADCDSREGWIVDPKLLKKCGR